MRRLLPVLLCWFAVALTSCAANDERLTHVRYLGEEIPLAIAYSDFHAYKDDPENLNPQVIPSVERLLRSASFGPAFPNADAVSTSLNRLSFPGYGTFYANQPGELELVYVEIPQRALNRYFVLERQSNGGLLVISDFVAASQPEIVRVHRRAGIFVYEGASGAAISPKSQ